MGPYELDADGNQYILAIICCFSRFLYLVAVPDTTTETKADCIGEADRDEASEDNARTISKHEHIYGF